MPKLLLSNKIAYAITKTPISRGRSLKMDRTNNGKEIKYTQVFLLSHLTTSSLSSAIAIFALRYEIDKTKMKEATVKGAIVLTNSHGCR